MEPEIRIVANAEDLAREAASEFVRRAKEAVRTNGLFTVHLGPDQVVAAMSADFMDTLSAADVEAIVADIEDRVKKVHPEAYCC